jgi:hypothetical protein
MITHREFGSSYYHKPKLQGGGLLPSHGRERCRGVGEEEEVAGGDWAAVPPTIFCRRQIADSLFRSFNLHLHPS